MKAKNLFNPQYTYLASAAFFPVASSHFFRAAFIEVGMMYFVIGKPEKI